MPEQIRWLFRYSARCYWLFNEIVYYDENFNAHVTSARKFWSF